MTQDDTGHDRPPPPLPPRRRPVRRALTPLVVVLAAIYFLIDALFLPPVRAFARWLGRFRLLNRLADGIRALPPYPTLALFLVPLILLEPVKPVAAYLFATGHLAAGAVVLVVGEVLKITIVERLFHIGRDKLMMIPAFAWAYNFVVGWLAYLQALPAWQAVLRHVRPIKAAARRTWLRVRAQLHGLLAAVRKR